MKFAQKLAVLRWRQGWSQEELAERMGVSSQAVSEWESELNTPDLDQVLLLSQLLETSMDTLLKEDRELEPFQETEKEPGQQAAGKASLSSAKETPVQTKKVQLDHSNQSTLNSARNTGAAGQERTPSSGPGPVDWMNKEQIPPTLGHQDEAHQQIPNTAVMPEIPTDPVIDLYTAKKYLEMKEYTAPKLGRAIGYFVASPAALLFMIGLAVGRFHGRDTLLLILAGVLFMLIIVAVGVYSIVQIEALQKPYANLFRNGYFVDTQAFAFAHRVKEEWNSSLQKRLAFGIVCCIISPAPLLMMIWFLNPFAIFLGISLMLLIVALGVCEIVRAGNLKSALNALLQDEQTAA